MNKQLKRLLLCCITSLTLLTTHNTQAVWPFQPKPQLSSGGELVWAALIAAYPTYLAYQLYQTHVRQQQEQIQPEQEEPDLSQREAQQWLQQEQEELARQPADQAAQDRALAQELNEYYNKLELGESPIPSPLLQKHLESEGRWIGDDLEFSQDISERTEEQLRLQRQQEEQRLLQQEQYKLLQIQKEKEIKKEEEWRKRLNEKLLAHEKLTEEQERKEFMEQEQQQLQRRVAEQDWSQ